MKHKKLILILHTLLAMQLNFSIVNAIDIKTYTNNYDGNDNLNSVDTNRAKFDSLIRRGDANIYGFVREYHDTIWYDSTYEYLKNDLFKNPHDKEVSLKSVTFYKKLVSIRKDSAIYNYKKALLIYPNNDKTLLKLAIIYDTMDSVKLAEEYYNKVKNRFVTLTNTYNQTEYPEIDVKKIKDNFIYSDSLEILFKKFGRESSITFDIEIATSAFPTYNDNYTGIFLYKLFNKRIFITVYGNGEFEARKYDSLKKSKVYFEGKLPDSTLSVILNLLQEGRILSMKSLFQKEEKSVNRFMGPYSNYLVLITHNMDRAAFERITIETPLVSNSVSIMYLIGCDELSQDTNLFEKGCCKDIQLIYDNKHLNKTDTKIKLLEELWKYVYCLDLSKYCVN
jgi:hypothetical protein